MLITDKTAIADFSIEKRLWQGIPSIEVSKKGRIFLTYYSGGTKEEIGNYVILSKSDNGDRFDDIAIAYKDGFRCYDSCLWIDPLGRLWFTWAIAPDHAVFASVCDDPDAEELVWNEPRMIGREVMMNKPTVLSTGEWLFPIAVWNHNGVVDATGKQSDLTERLAFAYKSVDNGKTFEKLGGANIPRRSYDEHMILELNDGRLAMYVRTTYGIGVSYSYDRGKTWTEGESSGWGGPCSRFHVTRLKSGRVLLINHYKYTGRSHLTAMLSEDDGKTWPYKLLLDERANVSYPDAKETDDGYIYITYDRERGAFLNSLDKVYASAREVLIAKITEEDILNGELTDSGSFLKKVAQKLGKYAFENSNPYKEISRYSDSQLQEYLSNKSLDDTLSFLFDQYQINCTNMHRLNTEKLDSLIDFAISDGGDKTDTVGEIIKTIRSTPESITQHAPIVEKAKELISNSIPDDISAIQIAKQMNISKYYLSHIFKKTTGITIVDFKNEIRITMAKSMLINSDKKIIDIALECGFGSASYFSKVFIKSEGITPAEYRNMLKR